MNRYILSLLLSAIATCGITAANPAKALLKKLAETQKRGIMVAHQDATVYGTTWKWDTGRCDVKEVCGDYPAIIGFDLGKLELGEDKNLDGVPFSRMRQEIISHHQRGGIITLSWHAFNPATGGNTWDINGNAVTKMLPGGELNATLDKWLGRVAGFINSLTTPDGKHIPVIFRPWHEMNGGWFWWGSKSCEPQQYAKLYQYTHGKLTAMTHENIVWAYSPNLTDGDETERNFMKYYPGDKYVDLLGVDVYQFSSDNATYQANVKKELDVIVKLGREHKKITALTETGYRNVPDSKWFSTCLLPAIEQYPISYVLLWRNAWDNPEENYIAAPEKKTADDFRLFHDNDKTLFLKDILKD